MTGKKVRRATDVLMLLVLFVLMGYHLTGQLYHEIAGTVMFVLALLHVFVNRRWYGSMPKGRYTAGRIVRTVVNIALSVDILLLILSGISMSRYVFRFLPFPVSMMYARSIHLVAAYSGYLLMSMHLGLHLGPFIRKAGRRIPVFIRVLLTAGLFVYGVYAVDKRKFFDYITGKAVFAFFDYNESPLFFYLDYLAILVLGILVIQCLLFILGGGLKGTLRKLGSLMQRHKVLFAVLGVLLLVGAVLFRLFGFPYIRRHYMPVHVDRAEVSRTETVDMGGMNALIVCFTRNGNTDFDADVDAVSSASLMEDNGTLIGNSELLADMISNAAGFDIYQIRVQEPYSSSYADTVSEANEEMKSGTIRELEGELPDLKGYDSVILVYPLWWWTLPQPVQTFLQRADLSGKTLYSVVTHGGSKFGNALADTEQYTNAAVSPNALEVYDDEVTKAAPKVTAWLKTLAG